MKKELKDILEQMLFMSDQQVLSEDFKKINFKKKNWFKKYTWTAKTEERFIEWLTEHLKKNWQALVDIKPTGKKLREKIAREFVFNYGCVVRPLNSNDFDQVVSWEQLKDEMSKEELERFNEWMFGQTTPLYGVYRYDLLRWLNNLPNLD